MKNKKLILLLLGGLLPLFVAQADEIVIFHETFSKLTVLNTTTNALTGGNTDESGYVVLGGASDMKCDEDGSMTFKGGRFKTRTLDLTGTVKLYVTYKSLDAAGGKFQIDVNKEGTSGMGTLFSEKGSDATSPTSFFTIEKDIMNGTGTSFIHFRTESKHSIAIDEIKVVKIVESGGGTEPEAGAPTLSGVTVGGNAVTPSGTDLSYTLPYAAADAPLALAYACSDANTTVTVKQGDNPVEGLSLAVPAIQADGTASSIEYTLVATSNVDSSKSTTYTLTLNREAADASLKTLTVNGRDALPTMTATLASGEATFDLKATANLSTAAVKIELGGGNC